MEFPILHDPGSIEQLLRSIFKTAPPKLVDQKYIIGLGFKRELDDGFLKLLLFLDLIDEHGQPTVLWNKSLDPELAPMVLKEAVVVAYGSLFNRFPNAYKEEEKELMEFFRVETGDSDPNVAYMILTFKVLCDLAGVTEVERAVKSPKPAKETPAEKKPKAPKTKQNPAEEDKPVDPPQKDGTPLVRLSINIDLDDRADPDLRDLVMKLLKRQLEL